jgi:hypothetical protein
MHNIRSAYGWTDDQILDHAEIYGIADLLNIFKMIQEDKVEQWRMEMNIAPLSRTPMEKKGSSSLKDYEKKLSRVLDSLVPWQKRSSSIARQRGKIEEGKTIVILEGGESSKSPLFKDAKITRE